MPHIRLELPLHLRRLAALDTHEAVVEVATTPATLHTTLTALEARFPTLCGAIRDHDTLIRRPFLRFFALNEDITHLPTDTPLPEAIQTGREPLLIIGAIAGG